MIKKFNVDLTNCDIEPIHILGRIQSHGFLVAVDIKTLLIAFISENIQDIVHREPKHYLNQPFSDFLNDLNNSNSAQEVTISQVMTADDKDSNREPSHPVYIKLNDVPFYLITHVSGDCKLLEFEPAISSEDLDVQQTIGRSLSEILAATSLESMFKNAAIQVKNIISYDRVMIYRFSEEGHGEVIAEEKNEYLQPFLGLHYPATDVPKQARILYKNNLTRIIADVNSETSAIITVKGEEMPLDLTHSALRAVSPIHIQYLKNMGVQSSFSISLIANKELWGLIVCHNYSPKFINYKSREVAKLFGQILSSALEYRQGEADSETFGHYNDSVNNLIANLENEEHINEALFREDVSVNDITSATGSILVFNNQITRIGITPDDEQIRALLQWLKMNMSESIYSTNRLPQIYPAAKLYSNVASGLMACMLSKELGEFIIWFKPEQIESVNWAGNPDKTVEHTEGGVLHLSPRKSFDSWIQIVENTSESWSRAEIAAVVNLREHIIYFIKRKANEIRQLNERLKLAYEELDTFSYTVSHDLRTPLSSIKSYSELLLANNKHLDENAKRILGRINACADKMALLIKEILNYSSVGKADIDKEPIDMALIVNEVKADIIEALHPENLELIIGETPDISGDKVMIKQVFSNLINNAVKYSSQSNPSIVTVEGVIKDKQIVYKIRDNGIGIDEKYYNLVFELFKRMDNVKDFEGTGVGLAIVKRIMEKHNAKIWFESQLGFGTTFYLSFDIL